MWQKCKSCCSKFATDCGNCNTCYFCKYCPSEGIYPNIRKNLKIVSFIKNVINYNLFCQKLDDKKCLDYGNQYLSIRYLQF